MNSKLACETQQNFIFFHQFFSSTILIFYLCCVILLNLVSQKLLWSENKFISSISITRNLRYLLKISKHPDEVSCLHGIRVLSTFGIVLHHSIAYRAQYANKNSQGYQIFHRSMLDYTNTSLTGIVDTFFVITSALLTRSILRDIKWYEF